MDLFTDSDAKPSLKHEPNAIIIHCGTNNLKEAVKR